MTHCVVAAFVVGAITGAIVVTLKNAVLEYQDYVDRCGRTARSF